MISQCFNTLYNIYIKNFFVRVTPEILTIIDIYLVFSLHEISS